MGRLNEKILASDMHRNPADSRLMEVIHAMSASYESNLDIYMGGKNLQGLFRAFLRSTM